MPQSSVIVALVAAFPGMNADSSDGTDNYVTRISGETSLQLPFGALVMQGTNDDQCVSFTSQTGVPIGIVSYSAAYQINHELASVADSNGNLGLLPLTTIGLKKRGKMWVIIDENVNPTSTVRVRTTRVSNVGPGTFRASSSAGVTNNLSKFCKWAGTYTAASGVGLLEFDFTMSANMTAD